MNALKIVLAIIAVLIILIVIAYAYYGGFKTISFRIEEQGGETIVYEEMIGDYSQTPKVQDKIYDALLNDEKIETTKGFGIYYPVYFFFASDFFLTFIFMNSTNKENAMAK